MNDGVDSILRRFQRVRETSESLCSTLEVEDMQIQPEPWVSPPKWHLAHTSWFFEEFVIPALLMAPSARPVPLAQEGLNPIQPFDPSYRYLFNSYYKGVGAHLPQPKRGLLSRPPLRDVLRYRAHVTQSLKDALFTSLAASGGVLSSPYFEALELGIHHEEQHQELLVMDIKYILWSHPLKPPGLKRREAMQRDAFGVQPPSNGWASFQGGNVFIGADPDRFAFDHERPCHEVRVYPYRIARRPVSAGEYREFIDAGGYSEPRFWLSMGWEVCKREGWEAPLYWERDSAGGWVEFTEQGMGSIAANSPVRHISFFEADAFARWSGARLPTEAEWENAARHGAFVSKEGWEWTSSPYGAYPGFKPLSGVFGEYNGKFMCNQMVLRGESPATPVGHGRVSYRNYFPPESRWVFSALRLAQDESGTL